MTVDEGLLEKVRQALGTRTKRETILESLRETLRQARLRQILEHRGKLDLGLTKAEILKRRERA